ncbi:S-layer homology domain-containing protein [Cohnella sp. WQ 127256]|uniref:S-layer homology domain-containing protein n=1 Tax=Cohnella sp. WQ 127256 TaxID=2938790 RepID=UPI002119040D|nr:S-layer homology domain-containing protein [Cohnella sp. WQ 127256]
MIKKWILSTFAFILLFSLAVPPANAAFPDVNKSYSWARQSIDFLADRKVIAGYEDGSFKPGKSITKAELTVMIYRLFPDLRASEPKSIPGIPKTHWASKVFAEVYSTTWPIYAADKQNWLKESFSYSPDKVMTRWEVMMVLDALFSNLDLYMDIPSDKSIMQTLAKTKDVKKKILSGKQYDIWWKTASTMSPIVGVDQNNSSGIKVSSDIEYMKAEALHRFSKLGLMVMDKQGNFYPSRMVTRAEISTILYRLYNIYQKTPLREPKIDLLDIIPSDADINYIYPDSGVGVDFNLYTNKAGNKTFYAAFDPNYGEKAKLVRLKVESEQVLDLNITVNNVTTLYTYEQLTDEANPVTFSTKDLLYMKFKIDYKARYPERVTKKSNNDVMIWVLGY